MLNVVLDVVVGIKGNNDGLCMVGRFGGDELSTLQHALLVLLHS